MKRELEMERNGNGGKGNGGKGNESKRNGGMKKGKKGRREGVGERITHFEATKNDIRKLVCHFFCI